ncbi:MAG: hypothetical protein ACYC4R_01820 [Anaerolineae bacterium]
MAGPGAQPVEPTSVMYCINHPRTETLLRCSRCLRPICTRCAIRAPVGLRCPDCARIGRSPLYVLQPQHYVVAGVVALALSLVGGALIPYFGLWIAFFLSIPVGGIIAEAVMRAIRGKRGRPVQIITAAAIALGALAGPWVWPVLQAGTLAVLPSDPLAFLVATAKISSLLYAALAISAAVARLR